MSKRSAFILFIYLYLGFVGTNVLGQIFFTGKPETVNFYSFPYFKSWNLSEDQKVSQFSLPLFVQILPIKNLSLWISNSVASSEVKWNGGEPSNLSGINDLKTKLSYGILNHKLIATLGMNFPIGISRLDQDQIEVANVIYDEVLGFSVNKLGGGFEVNPGIIFAIDIGAIGAGVSAGYLLKGSYKSIKDSDSDYNPGDEINMVLALDFVQDLLSLYGDIAYTIYTKDKIDDSEAFKQGNEIKGRIFMVLNSEPIILTLSLSDTIRMKNKILGENGKLITEEMNSHGNKIDINLNSRYYFNRKISLVPSTGITLLSDNGYKENGAFIWNLGTGIQFSPNRRTSFILSGKILNGNMQSGELGISGFEIGAVAIIRF